MINERSSFAEATGTTTSASQTQTSAPQVTTAARPTACRTLTPVAVLLPLLSLLLLAILLSCAAENGIKSLLLDDDNCGCESTLSMGHGMCSGGYSSSYGYQPPKGVDYLDDHGCSGKGVRHLCKEVRHNYAYCTAGAPNNNNMPGVTALAGCP